MEKTILKRDLRELKSALAEGEAAPPYGESISRATAAWLQAAIPDQSYVEFLIKNGINSTKQACCNYLHGAADIVRWTTMYKTIEGAYVILGCASNGDFVAVPKKWNSIGYISAAEFQYDQVPHVPYAPVDTSIGKFFYATWHTKNYPCDYYDAIRNRKRLPK